MAVDLAIDFGTGDLKIAPSKDLDRATGQTEVDQRIRVRLKIIQGQWTLDPTGGTLGSRLIDAIRQPMFRALEEVPLLVTEALQPMDDINLMRVDATQDENDAKAINIVIYYQIKDSGDETTQEEELTTSITLAG